jgi:hypothetical protein
MGGRGSAAAFPATFGPHVTRPQELDALKHQANYFEQALDDVRSRIKMLESSTEGPKST